MHRLLKRQLKHTYGKNFDIEELDQRTKELLQKVESEYHENDKEKRFLDHMIEINSKELNEAYRTIEKHNESLKMEVSEKESILNQYKEAIDTTLIVSKTNTKGIITYVNDKFCSLSGYTREELMGKSHNMVRAKNVKPELFKDLWDTIQSKKIWEGTLENTAKNGDSYYVEATVCPLLDTKGEILEYIAIRYNVTDRILASKALRKEQRISNAIFSNQQNIVVTMTHSDGITKANNNFLTFLDFKNLEEFKEAHKCICELFVQGEGLLKPSEGTFNWTDPILEEPSIQHKAVMRGKDGIEHTFVVSVTEVDFDDEPFFVASFTDVTELKIAIEIAEASIQEKSDFMANMSHEIRTPMNSIVGFTQLLKNTPLNAKQQSYLDLVENSTKMLLSIVNDILDFSKIENGKLVLDMIEVNPFLELQKSISVFKSKAKEKEILFKIDMDSRMRECIWIDQLRVVQILNNLIGNALKFTLKKGTVSVKIEVLSQEESSQLLRFSVRDTGIGIAKNRLKEIFKSFVQEDGSTTRNFGGTGLGLSISSSLCELMQSKLMVESTQGEGSMFYFDLNVNTCVSQKTLSSKIKDTLPVYVVIDDSPIYNTVLIQLTNFKLTFTTVFNNDLIWEKEETHTVIMFDYTLYVDDKMKNHHVVLVDESREAVKLMEKYENIYHIDNYKECPSQLYNVLNSLNSLGSSQKEIDDTQKVQFELSVLVAEDYEINRILIEEIMKDYNIVPDFAFNGEEAVKKVSAGTYDIIFMDINMPILNGIEATKALRELGVSTPIIALTANALEGDREHYISQGMDDYLSKPIEIETLISILKKYTSKKTSDSDAEPLSENGGNKENKKYEDIISNILTAKEKMHFSTTIMKKLFDSFVMSSADTMGKLLDAVECEDIENIKVHAHAIRGSALSLHFNKIGELCKILEYDDSVDYRNISQELKVHIDFLYTKKTELLGMLSEIDND